jgi:hypothetical protein
MYRSAQPKPVIRQMARQLGVHPEALRTWIRADEGRPVDKRPGRVRPGVSRRAVAVPELPAGVGEELDKFEPRSQGPVGWGPTPSLFDGIATAFLNALPHIYCFYALTGGLAEERQERAGTSGSISVQ